MSDYFPFFIFLSRFILVVDADTLLTKLITGSGSEHRFLGRFPVSFDKRMRVWLREVECDETLGFSVLSGWSEFIKNYNIYFIIIFKEYFMSIIKIKRALMSNTCNLCGCRLRSHD